MVTLSLLLLIYIELNNCKDVCNGVNYILYQAVLGSVPRTIEDPVNTNSSNIDGLLNILVII